MFKLRMSALLCTLLASTASAQERSARTEREQLADDPTKIITKLGVRYTEDLSISGSVAFGPVSKINASYSETGEWSLGGSYLFNFGIVNVAASRKDLDNGTSQTQYSLGTFVPLSALGAQTGQWQLFPMAGVNYVEGTAIDVDTTLSNDIPVATSSKGGYLGVMGLRPLSDKWVFRGVLVGSAGSDNYSGYTIGGGFSYMITKRDRVSAFASYIDNSFGTRDVVGISYSREF